MKMFLFVLMLAIVPSFAQTNDKAPLTVTVTDIQKTPKKGEQILFVGKSSNKTFKGISGENGQFNIDLPGGETYLIKIKSVGDATDYNTITIPELQPNQSYGEYQVTVMFEMPKVFTLNNLHFDVGKATIRSGSYGEINDLVELMKLKPTMKIRVEGHTDSDGDESSNLELSQDRAEAVRKYLISEGIDASRVEAVGYGETRPVSSNKTTTGKQMNRRTEIHITQQ